MESKEVQTAEKLIRTVLFWITKKLVADGIKGCFLKWVICSLFTRWLKYLHGQRNWLCSRETRKPQEQRPWKDKGDRICLERARAVVAHSSSEKQGQTEMKFYWCRWKPAPLRTYAFLMNYEVRFRQVVGRGNEH